MINCGQVSKEQLQQLQLQHQAQQQFQNLIEEIKHYIIQIYLSKTRNARYIMKPYSKSNEFEPDFLDYLSFDERKYLLNHIRSSNMIKLFEINVRINFPDETQERVFQLVHNTKKEGKYYFYNTLYLLYDQEFNENLNYLGKMYEYDSGKIFFKPGFLDDFLEPRNELSNFIQIFAKNTIRILKNTVKNKGLIMIPEKLELSKKLIWKSIFLGILLLTTERFRSDLTTILTYIEFYKLKKINNKDQSMICLKHLFDRDNALLIFPCDDGTNKILNTKISVIKKYIMSLVDDNLPFQAKYELLNKKFEKMKAILENKPMPSFNKHQMIGKDIVNQIFITIQIKKWCDEEDKLNSEIDINKEKFKLKDKRALLLEWDENLKKISV